MSHNSQNESYSGPPPARPTDQESPPPDFHPAAAEDTTIPTAERLIGLTPAGLRADPDKWPDPARPPNIRRAVNHVEILNGERAISQTEAVITNEDKTSGLTDCPRGNAAQIFIDVVQEALGLPGLPPQLRRKYLNALCHTCGCQGLLPKSLQIPHCYNRSDVPQYSGGYADVWKGEYQGHPVAAKVLRVYLTSDFDKIRRRFCKEVMTWKTLSHPNVLPLLGVTMDNKHFVMVSEWMVNGNINEFIKAHCDVDRFELLKDVARGLIYMHDQAMVHGDLKGANILIDQNGHARLADFGFLTIVSDPTDPTASSSYTLGGTIRWMSPELLTLDRSGLKNGRPTKQSDCYALGMVIYEVLSGQAPFAPFNHYIVIQKVVEGERPERPEGMEGPWFTDDLWETLGRCWSSQPKRRPSIAAVLGCLERVSRDPEPPPPQVDEDLGTDEGDQSLISGPSERLPRFDHCCLVAMLWGIVDYALGLCLRVHLKIFPRKRS